MAGHSAAVISTEELARRMGAPALRIFDCTTYLKPGPDGRYIAESGRANYDKGHVPGAAKGVGHGTFVVLYSHASPVWATRIWWMLRAVGFDDVAILDGGLDKWKAENRPVSTEAATHPPATLSLRARPELFVDKKKIKDAIGAPDTLTLNALSHDQHKGAGGVVYGRAGRIAGSSCVPAASLFGADKALKPIAELRAAFEGVGAAPDKRVLVYCGGGIAATLDAFVLTAMLGHRNVSVYDNSMQEWANDPALPMEMG